MAHQQHAAGWRADRLAQAGHVPREAHEFAGRQFDRMRGRADPEPAGGQDHPAGGRSLLLDVAALGRHPAEVCQALLGDGAITARPMTGWGADVAARHVRFVYSAEPLDRLRTLPERLAAAGLR